MDDSKVGESAMTADLSQLRKELTRLGRRRQLVRMAQALSNWFVILLWTLIIAFAVDRFFAMTRPQRCVSLALTCGLTLYAWQRFVRRSLRTRESEFDLALLVERERRIDSDLVAALQFESNSSERLGSTALKQAVISDVAQSTEALEISATSREIDFPRKLVPLFVTLLGICVAATVWPGYVPAFLNRFILGTAHYPTRTVIDRILVNGRVVFPRTSADGASHEARVVMGSPLRFEVHYSGVTPATGKVVLRTLNSEQETAIELMRPAATEAEPLHVFVGELRILSESATYQIFLGDAWTDPRVVQIVQRPIVTLDWECTPPPYAASSRTSLNVESGALRFSVLEGTRVQVHLKCENKILQSATGTLNGQKYSLVKKSDTDRWTLAAETPLDCVAAPVAFSFQIEDEDGLDLPTPLAGQIRIERDRLPRVAAAVVTTNVLPAARPVIAYGATDDYGLSLLQMRLQIVHPGGLTEDASRTIFAVSKREQPPKQLKGTYSLDLKPLKLVKGDAVRITLEGVDYRGTHAGLSTASEPIVLQVTDESGVLAGLIEADKKSAQQLDSIIQRLLGDGTDKNQ